MIRAKTKTKGGCFEEWKCFTFTVFRQSCHFPLTKDAKIPPKGAFAVWKVFACLMCSFRAFEHFFGQNSELALSKLIYL